MLGRRTEQAQAVADIINTAGGSGVTVEADVLVRTQLQTARDLVLGQWGRQDILVNAAGGNMPEATLTPGHSFFDMPVQGVRSGYRFKLAGYPITKPDFWRSHGPLGSRLHN